MVGKKPRNGVNSMVAMIFVSAFPNIILREGLNINLPWLRWQNRRLISSVMISVNKKLFPSDNTLGFWRFL